VQWPNQYALSFSLADIPVRTSHDIDRWFTAPIYNYSRFVQWVENMEEICEQFPGMERHRPRTLLLEWRFWVASALAVILQWGTTGAAIVVNYFTPTTGLGCHSGGSLLYGATSTVVWILLVLSSLLSRSHRQASNLIWWLGRLLAVLNSVWIVILCVFLLSNFLDRCWCNGGVIQRKAKAYVVAELLPDDIAGMKQGWKAAVGLGLSSCLLYAGLIYVLCPA